MAISNRSLFSAWMNKVKRRKLAEEERKSTYRAARQKELAALRSWRETKKNYPATERQRISDWYAGQTEIGNLLRQQ